MINAALRVRQKNLETVQCSSAAGGFTVLRVIHAMRNGAATKGSKIEIALSIPAWKDV